MGVYLSRAKTTKESEHGGSPASGCSRYGLTSMQGWRQSMEDAHLAMPSVAGIEGILKKEIGLYGVFDGHGGPAVSEWIAKHLTDVVADLVKEVSEEVSKNSVQLCSEVPTEVAVLCEALQRAFIRLDEDMQTKPNREEIKQIHNEKAQMDMEDQQSDGQGVQGGQSLRGLLSNQPRTLLQALLGTGGGKPMIKLVEQDGEQFFQITPNEENKAEASEGEGPLSSEPQIEEIVEDPHVTAPETKSPRLQTVAAEVLGSSSGESNDTPATPAEMSLRQTAEAHQTSSSSDEDEDGDDAEKDGIINDELDDEDRAQLPSGGPDSCGAAVVVTALVGGEKPFLITANAGDSRCVLCRNGKAVAMSEDHKPQLESENNRIIKAGGKVIGGRVDGNLNLSRTLGDLFYKRNKGLKPEEQKITAYPDVRVLPITKEDEFVILACDGIWDCVTNQEACDFVRSRMGPTPDPKRLSEICEELCDECLAGNPMESEGGIGCDNMTCIIVLLNERYRSSGSSEGGVNMTLYEGHLHRGAASSAT